MDPEDHPVIKALRESQVLATNYIDRLAQKGRSYVGRSLPKGTREWKVGQCVEASEYLAGRNGWKQVQGWCVEPGATVGAELPFFHMWNSIDGETAIDATLPADECSYWGMPARNDWRESSMVLGIKPDPLKAMQAEFRDLGLRTVGLPVGGLRGLRPWRMM